jgi:hypothetical protein
MAAGQSANFAKEHKPKDYWKPGGNLPGIFESHTPAISK